jgi:hypothetical protein
MMVIVASRHDPLAQAVANRWQAHDARVLTPRDLSLAGWQYRPGDERNGTAVIAGQVVPTAEIDAVLTCLAGVWLGELPEIVVADREYVAAEMTAFLLAWLTSLGPRVHNRPTPTSLTGPFWRPERWVHAAAQAGIPIRPLHRTAAPDTLPALPLPASGATRVTVIGPHAVGQVDEALKAQALQLARLAGIELLTARFDGPQAGARFTGADFTLDLAAEEVVDALLAYLLNAERGDGR